MCAIKLDKILDTTHSKNSLKKGAFCFKSNSIIIVPQTLITLGPTNERLSVTEKQTHSKSFALLWSCEEIIVVIFDYLFAVNLHHKHPSTLSARSKTTVRACTDSEDFKLNRILKLSFISMYYYHYFNGAFIFYVK